MLFNMNSFNALMPVIVNDAPITDANGNTVDDKTQIAVKYNGKFYPISTWVNHGTMSADRMAETMLAFEGGENLIAWFTANFWKIQIGDTLVVTRRYDKQSLATDRMRAFANALAYNVSFEDDLDHFLRTLSYMDDKKMAGMVRFLVKSMGEVVLAEKIYRELHMFAVDYFTGIESVYHSSTRKTQMRRVLEEVQKCIVPPEDMIAPEWAEEEVPLASSIAMNEEDKWNLRHGGGEVFDEDMVATELLRYYQDKEQLHEIAATKDSTKIKKAVRQYAFGIGGKSEAWPLGLPKLLAYVFSFKDMPWAQEVDADIYELSKLMNAWQESGDGLITIDWMYEAASKLSRTTVTGDWGKEVYNRFAKTFSVMVAKAEEEDEAYANAIEAGKAAKKPSTANWLSSFSMYVTELPGKELECAEHKLRLFQRYLSDARRYIAKKNEVEFMSAWNYELGSDKELALADSWFKEYNEKLNQEIDNTDIVNDVNYFIEELNRKIELLGGTPEISAEEISEEANDDVVPLGDCPFFDDGYEDDYEATESAFIDDCPF